MFQLTSKTMAGALALSITAANMACATQIVAENGQALPTVAYASIVDQVVQAPLIVDATVRSAARIKGAEAAGVPPGFVRFYVEADVLALIRGDVAVAPRVGWLVDLPADARGRTRQLRRLRVIAFARPVVGRPAQLQLVTPQSQFDWTPQMVERVRAVVRDTLAADAPPAITGVGNAFHVPGTLPGEGETQIFLQTTTGDPVSLSILRRPGEDTRWAVALGEIVDDAAGPPRRDTLLWYRLACGLPRDLPAESTADEEPARAAVAREDYRFVLDQLGPCRETPGDAPIVMR